jgi:DNA polymerase-3 subunit gamma/tau
MLLKGLAEVNAAAMPLEAAEMALLRVIHASELPDPGALMEKLLNGGALPAPSQASAAAPASPASVSAAASPPARKVPTSLAEIIQHLETGGHQLLAYRLEEDFRLVELVPGKLLLNSVRPANDARALSGFLGEVGKALKGVTGEAWAVQLSDGPAQPSIREQALAAQEQARQAVLATPLVKAAFEAFPDAELVHHSKEEQRSA